MHCIVNIFKLLLVTKQNDAEKKSQEDVATGKTSPKKRFFFLFGGVLASVCIVILVSNCMHVQ